MTKGFVLAIVCVMIIAALLSSCSSQQVPTAQETEKAVNTVQEPHTPPVIENTAPKESPLPEPIVEESKHIDKEALLIERAKKFAVYTEGNLAGNIYDMLTPVRKNAVKKEIFVQNYNLYYSIDGGSMSYKSNFIDKDLAYVKFQLSQGALTGESISYYFRWIDDNWYLEMLSGLTFGSCDSKEACRDRPKELQLACEKTCPAEKKNSVFALNNPNAFLCRNSECECGCLNTKTNATSYALPNWDAIKG